MRECHSCDPTARLRVIVTCVILLASAVGSAAAEGSLEGKELPAVDERRAGFESAAGALLGGSLKGEVLRAVVTTDDARRLVVQVEYTGFAGASMWGELLNADRRRQSQITMEDPVTLGDGGGELTLTFEAEPGATPTPTATLKISVAAPNRHSAGYTRSFRVGKTWTAADPSGENFSVLVTPQPVGNTAQLGATPTFALPPSTARSAPPPAAPAAAGGAKTVVPVQTRLAKTRAVIGASDAAVKGTRLISPGVTTPPAGGTGDRSPRGPGTERLRPFASVRTEDIDLDFSRVLNVYPDVIPDQNAKSGVYYFLPNAYTLTWNPTAGYGLRTTFATAAAGQVLMSARLGGGIGPRDLDLASKLVRSYAHAQRLEFQELRALPVDTLSISLVDQLASYSIPPDRVSVQGFSDVLGQFDVSWVTDERTKDFIQEALINGTGVQGSVTCAPPGGGPHPQVPVRVVLGDYDTFGPFRWERTGWKNETPYPIVLHYLHALRVPDSGPAVVNTWRLGDTRVPPGGQVRWSAAAVPFWMDGQAQKMWLDYSVDASCRPCGAGVLAATTSGVSAVGSGHITFHSMSPLAETGAHDIFVEVRSRHFDPRGQEVRVHTFVVDADEKDFEVGPLFVAGGSATDAAFEYRLALTMNDGSTVAGNAAWIRDRRSRVPIGRTQLEQSIGTLPAR